MLVPEISSPVLFLVFNRPDTTDVVFKAIRKAKPKKLYISADAPRKGNKKDQNDCEKVREIAKKVDWNCEVKYRFLDENLGCGYAVSSAISWAFESEDRLIILEDDCVPSISFFEYCNHCLEKYLKDERVWIISGRSHHENSKYFNEQDYIFSHYGHIWGWATWKRCWDCYDIEMNKWNSFYLQGGFLNSFFSKDEGLFFNKLYSRLAIDKELPHTTWDFQLNLLIHLEGGLSITPSKNLIQNIGNIGTHTSTCQKNDTLKAFENFKIEKEPIFVLANREYDLMHFNSHINPKTPFLIRILNKSLRILKLR